MLDAYEGPESVSQYLPRNSVQMKEKHFLTLQKQMLSHIMQYIVKWFKLQLTIDYIFLNATDTNAFIT